jgi:hypothetical protein
MNTINSLIFFIFLSFLCFFHIEQKQTPDILIEPDKIIVPEIQKPKKQSLSFVSVSEYRCLTPESVYCDVLNHSKQEPYGDKLGRYTNVHETAHGIHNELRNEYKTLLKRPVNVFYCLNGKAIVLPEPNIKIRHISKYIPKILRSSRYQLYLVDQTQYWDDVPLYILDEWNCYVLGGECAIDDLKKKVELEKTNAVSGCLEFSIYAVALAMAVKENDTIYWKSNDQFKGFIKYNLIRAERVFGAGSGVPEFYNKEQDRLYDALLNHPDAKELRDFLKSEFDGIFVD